MSLLPEPVRLAVYRFRSAISGRYVSKKDADEAPDSTVRERASAKYIDPATGRVTSTPPHEDARPLDPS